MSLRTLQARWTLEKIPPHQVHEVATVLLVNGVDLPALVELAGMVDATYREVAPVMERAVAEAGLAPMSREAALWHLAYVAAPQIVDGAVTPREGAASLWRICTELDMPEPLRYFIYLAADHGEGPNDPVTEAAWFDARIRENAAELLTSMPVDRESPPREPV